MLNFLRTWATSRTRTERAATLVEYALLVALIAVVCIAAISGLGTKVSGTFNSSAGAL